jgi:hypothetical protein
VTAGGHRDTVGSYQENLTVEAVAVAFSMAWPAAQVEGKTGDDRARGLLAAFRSELYRCFATYRDALFELGDAVLCAAGPVRATARCTVR